MSRVRKTSTKRVVNEKPKEWVFAGLDGAFNKMAVAQQHVTAEIMEDVTLRSLVGVATNAYDVADMIADLARPTSGGPMCQAGCWHCCKQFVAVTMPEIAACYVGVSASFETPEESLLFKHNFTNAAAGVLGLSVEERFRRRIVCPLLHQGRCLIYELRPLECRGFDSHDVNKCIAAYSSPGSHPGCTIPHTSNLKSGCHALTLGILKGLDDAGLPISAYELLHALNIAFNNRNAFDLWLAGDDVFASACYMRVEKKR